jgi:hypothetical protein
MLALCQHVEPEDESEVQIVALQCELLLAKSRAIRILRDAPAIERIRRELVSLGDAVESDRCGLLQGIDAAPFAHPWDQE